MAKQQSGILGGYIGKVGPVVGYMWNGKYCTRAYVRDVKNPRTAAQVEHRAMFKQEVQFAAKMRWAVGKTMRDAAREAGLTAYNLFVKVNQHAFGMDDEQLTVDYGTLILSMGDVPQTEMKEMEWTADNVLNVKYAMGHGSGFDHVYLYVYVPELDTGFLAAPAYRRDRRISVALPDRFAGHDAHVYLMVQSPDGRWSDSLYAGEIALNEFVDDEDEPLALPSDTPATDEEETLASAGNEPSPAAARPPAEAPPSSTGAQYTLF